VIFSTESSSLQSFISNNLSSASLDSILSAFVSSNIVQGNIQLGGQNSNALPTGQGLIDQQTLENRGVTVTTGN